MYSKSTSLTAVLAGVAALGVVSAAPAQAAIVGGGGFNLMGTTSVTNAGTATPTLNFTGFSVAAINGAFAGLGGNPVIKSLLLIDGNPSPNTRAVLSTNSLTDFITGLTLNGKALSFDLDATGIDLFGDVRGETDFNIAGPISGTFRSGNVALGSGFLGVNASGGVSDNLSNVSLVATEIPTPALLPGLVGMGVAALRKRKSLGAEETVES
ncbi:hypothetical protein BH23CYA1_BH23CYA1_21420 [soil metagenome]